jgi:predicted flap endonuclease-1-like 5' DNA nuclease
MFNLALTAEIAFLIAVFYLCGCVLGFAARWIMLRPPRAEAMRPALQRVIATGPEPAPTSADPALVDWPVEMPPAGGPAAMARTEHLEPQLVVGTAAEDSPVATNAGPSVEGTAEDGRPRALSKPRGGSPDDLKQIKGIGPKLESTLHDLGIFHFSQIASWSSANAAWVSARIGFAGRVEREGWVTQAKAIAKAARQKQA